MEDLRFETRSVKTSIGVYIIRIKVTNKERWFVKAYYKIRDSFLLSLHHVIPLLTFTSPSQEQGRDSDYLIHQPLCSDIKSVKIIYF